MVENVFPITLRTTITCNTCFCSSIKEDKSDILILPTFNQISSSLNESLKPETLSGEHMWSCPQCSELRESTRETSVSNCGDTFKDTKFVECLPVKDHILTVPLKLDDNVSFSKGFSLVSTINHSGSLNAGHYWAFIKDNISKSWFKCDDRSILKVKPSTLNNTTSYVLFYVINPSLSRGAKFTYFAFRLYDPAWTCCVHNSLTNTYLLQRIFNQQFHEHSKVVW